MDLLDETLEQEKQRRQQQLFLKILPWILIIALLGMVIIAIWTAHQRDNQKKHFNSSDQLYNIVQQASSAIEQDFQNFMQHDHAKGLQLLAQFHYAKYFYQKQQYSAAIAQYLNILLQVANQDAFFHDLALLKAAKIANQESLWTPELLTKIDVALQGGETPLQANLLEQKVLYWLEQNNPAQVKALCEQINNNYTIKERCRQIIAILPHLT